MRNIRSLSLKGTLLFRDETVDLSHKGVTVLLGKNLCAGGSRNAAGKSFLVRQLVEVIRGSPLGSRKDLVRQGTRSFDVQDGDGSVFTIEQTFSPKETLKIYKDGVDLGHHTLDAAQSAVEEIVGYNQAEVETLLYLDSQKPHPLIKGDTSERQKFFRTFFRLHGFAAIKKLIESELRGLDKAEGSVEELRRQLQECAARRLPDRASHETRREELAQHLKLASEREARRARVTSAYEAWCEVKDSWAVARSLEVLDAESLEAAKENAAEEIRKWDKILAQYAEIREQEERNARRAAEVKAARERVPKGREDPAAWAGAVEKTEKAIEARNAKIRDLSDQLEELLARPSARALARERQHLEACEDNCPTCGAPVDSRKKKADIAARIASLEEQVVADLAQIEEVRTALATVKERRTDLKGDLETLQEILAAAELLESARERAPLPTPKTSEEDARAGRKAALEAKATLDDLPTYMFRVRARWLEFSKADRSLANEEPEDVSSQAQELLTLDAELREDATAKADEKRIKARIAELTEQLQEREPLKVLSTAFAKGGVETEMIRILCARLESQANKLSPLVFPEDYSFSFELETHFSILARRRYNGKEVVSDVRTLSGAETRMFSLLLLMVLLVFVPEERRPSLLILDEPENALSPQFVERLLAFLPVLNSVIPSILVVTPQDPEWYRPLNPRYLTVVKGRNGRSRVKEGIV